MYSRPILLIYDTKGLHTGQVSTPRVLTSPIRPDIVHMVHTNLSKNRLQPHSVSSWAGHKNVAKSWGTGRAVARIPRVPGGGTNRSGQGAFGNMCRGGHMYAATKIWSRWHRKVNINVRRYAVVSAIAASSLVPVVMARGHKIESVPEIPLVLDDAIESVSATAKAMAILTAVGAGADVERSSASRGIRRGRGKLRNTRYVTRSGPMVVHANDYGISRAISNLPGVDVAKVEALNLLKLAPGGHIGRFLIWTKSAIDSVDRIFGSFDMPAQAKKGYVIPFGNLKNSDLASLINSDEVQSNVNKPKDDHKRKRGAVKKNPLLNKRTILKPNIYDGKQSKYRKGGKTKDKKTANLFYKQLVSDSDYRNKECESFREWLRL